VDFTHKLNSKVGYKMKPSSVQLVELLAKIKGWNVENAVKDAQLWVECSPLVLDETASIIEWYEETLHQGGFEETEEDEL
jgi:hypothetical protein